MAYATIVYPEFPDPAKCGSDFVTLVFEFATAAMHIDINPTHATSQQLAKLLDRYALVSKFGQECVLSRDEVSTANEIIEDIADKITKTLNESSLYYDAMARARDMTNSAVELLEQRGCDVVGSSIGRIDVKSIRQRDLYEVNKGLCQNGKQPMLLIRELWNAKNY